MATLKMGTVTYSGDASYIEQKEIELKEIAQRFSIPLYLEIEYEEPQTVTIAKK